MKPGSKKRTKAQFCGEKKKSLAESDKGSWFDQPSLEQEPEAEEQQPTSSSKPVGASRLKLCGESVASTSTVNSSSNEYQDSGDSESETDDSPCSSNRWTIVDRQKLNRELERSVVCRFGGNDSVISFEEVARTGLGAEWICRCKNPKCSSHEIAAPFHTTPKTSRYYDVNRKFVLGMRLVGRGYSAARKVLSILNLPPPIGDKPWAKHTKALECRERMQHWRSKSMKWQSGRWTMWTVL